MLTGHVVSSLGASLAPSCEERQNSTSALLITGLTLKLSKTFLLASTGSVATMSDAFTTPLAINPRARASAICPAPMKPTLFSSLPRPIATAAAMRAMFGGKQDQGA